MSIPKVFKKIDNSDFTIRPFQVKKNWYADHINYSSSYCVTLNKAITPIPTENYNNRLPLGSPLMIDTEATNSNGSFQKLEHEYLNHLFYDETEQDANHFGITNRNLITKHLYATASVIKIPNGLFGEKLAYESIDITDYSLGQSYPITIYDDGNGNLIDNAIPTSSMIPFDNLDAYWGFNEKYTTTKKHNGKVTDFSRRKNNIKYGNVSFDKGITTSGLKSVKSGNKSIFDGTGYMVLEDSTKLNYKTNDDFAISLWIELPSNQPNITGSFNHIISKQGDQFQKYVNDKTKKVEEYVVPYTDVVYPFGIRTYNQTGLALQGRIVVDRNDGIKNSSILSSTDLRGAEHHIVFNKTGSTLELYVDGVLDGTTIDKSVGKTHNDALLMLGSKGWNDSTGLSGSLDEVRFFNRGLTTNEVSSLSNNDYMTGSAYNTPYVGNVFYSQGQIVVTNPRPKYNHVLLGASGSKNYGTDNGFDLHWRSRQTIYEHQIICNIKSDEFNLTLNPTVREERSENSQLLNEMVQNEDWCPYISTVGLYNDYGQLLAVAKPANPLIKKCDVDMSIVVRYDL